MVFQEGAGEEFSVRFLMASPKGRKKKGRFIEVESKKYEMCRVGKTVTGSW